MVENVAYIITYVPTRTIYLGNWQRKINTTLLGNTVDGKHVLHFPTIGGHNIQPYWKIDGKHVLHFPTIGGHNIQPFWGIDGKHVLHFPTIL